MSKHTGIAGLSACIGLFLLSPVSHAGDGDSWSFWIEQGGRVLRGNPIRLAQAPFTFHFQGPTGHAYGLAATANPAELPSDTALSSVFRVTNGLLVDLPNSKISINDIGVIEKGWSSWNLWAYHAPEEKDLISGFHARTRTGNGQEILSRSIDQLCLDDGEKERCTPIGTPIVRKFQVLITLIPPLTKGQGLADTRWLEPKRVGIEFR